ncbi:hypothetical protein [Acetobacter senegalensis]|uniref:hypothetical protein n=1 Tax=Acetobacter senegalensis TaxID=446692 RepID=UPI0012FE3FEF|nr:hypothetical protein [Acetobacter senegalensis]
MMLQSNPYGGKNVQREKNSPCLISVRRADYHALPAFCQGYSAIQMTDASLPPSRTLTSDWEDPPNRAAHPAPAWQRPALPPR